MKLGTCALSVAVGLSLGSVASAAATESVTVQASVVSVLSVALSGTLPSNFVGVAAGTTVIADSAIIATNDGSGLNEAYELRITNPADWTSAAAPGQNVFAMYGKFNVAAPAASSYTVSHVLTTGLVKSTAALFAGDQDAASVAWNTTRNLWLQFYAPTLTSSSATQNISVTVVAVLP